MPVSGKQVVRGILGLLVVVFLGALGSGLWLHALEPFVRFILRLASLGFDTYKVDVYKEIARGLHEYASYALFGTVTAIWVGLQLGLLLALFTLMWSKAKMREREERIRSAKKWVYAYGLLFVFLSTAQLIAVARHTYINSAVTHFRQVLRIASPYLDESEQAVILSQFAQVKSKEDYVRIVDRLADSAETHGQNVPPFDPW